jgi:hypothetical protein
MEKCKLENPDELKNDFCIYPFTQCDKFCVFKFRSHEYEYCYVLTYIAMYAQLIYFIYYFRVVFLITSIKSIYDFIVSEIIHRDVPWLKLQWKKLFHFFLPVAQILQFFFFFK